MSALPAAAQEGQAAGDSLEAYQPPPMFSGQSRQEDSSPRPVVKPQAVEGEPLIDSQASKPAPPPLPSSKPDIQDDWSANLANPSKEEILKNIKPVVERIEGPDPAPLPLQAEEPKADKDEIRLFFPPGSTRLPPDQAELLPVSLREKISQTPDARIQIQAYAAPPDDDGSRSAARRLSLDRALVVQKILVDNDFNPEAIDIMPLGQYDQTPPLDYVNIVVSP